MSPELEYRSALELRADGAHLVGYAIVFDQRSRDLGGFVEVVRPSAITRSLSGDIVALLHHNPAAVLGRTPKTLQVRADARGLAFDLDPAPTAAGREAVELVKRGDLTGVSFGFNTVTDAWRRDGDTIVRELHDISIQEISLTAFPAYQQTDVSVAQRSLQQWQQDHHPVSGRRIEWLRRTMKVSG